MLKPPSLNFKGGTPISDACTLRSEPAFVRARRCSLPCFRVDHHDLSRQHLGVVLGLFQEGVAQFVKHDKDRYNRGLAGLVLPRKAPDGKLAIRVIILP